ncbi:hypothetical protein [Pseudonocardia acidicola]|nr:hypothetical protein [Pseudonocardia acidicola]
MAEGDGIARLAARLDARLAGARIPHGDFRRPGGPRSTSPGSG